MGLLSSLKAVRTRFSERITPSKIEGCVEGFDSGHTLIGWASDKSHPDHPCCVVAELRGRIIVETYTDINGPDALSRFALALNGKVKAREIVERDVRIFAVGRDGKKVELACYGPFMVRLMRQVYPD